MRRAARVRLALAGGEKFDAILDHDTAQLATAPTRCSRPTRELAAIARDLRSGMTAL